MVSVFANKQAANRQAESKIIAGLMIIRFPPKLQKKKKNPLLTKLQAFMDSLVCGSHQSCS